MIITACICFYNAVKELERCLDSLDLDKKYGIDYALCVDGKYPNFKGNSKLSTDGSKELVQSYSNAAILDCADYEIHKRNLYLNVTENLTDYILIIDSDEYIEPDGKDWKAFRKNLASIHKKNPGHDIWSIDIESNSDDYVETVEQILGKPYQKKKRHSWDIREYQPKPRIWYHPWQFEYFLNHYTWRHKDPNYPDYMRESVFGVTSWDVIPGIKLLHDHKLRNQEHLEKRLQYHRWLIQFEQQKAGHYFKHHDFKPLPHDLSIVDKWTP
jgi:glycosyltransferase involved in cell wall biosynthesis